MKSTLAFSPRRCFYLWDTIYLCRSTDFVWPYRGVEGNKVTLTLLFPRGVRCMCGTKRGEVSLNRLVAALIKYMFVTLI